MAPATLKAPEIGTEAIAAGLPEEFRKLTAKQRLFVIQYAITRKGVEAARLAGYSGDYASLNAIAVKMLQNASILAAFDAYMRPQFEEHGVTVQRVIQHIADLAFAPWGDYISVKERHGHIVSVKMNLSAKVEMLKVLAKMLRLPGMGKEVEDISMLVDQSQNLHFHARTADEARQALLAYLSKRQLPSHRVA